MGTEALGHRGGEPWGPCGCPECTCPSPETVKAYIEKYAVFERKNLVPEINAKLSLPNHMRNFIFQTISADTDYNDCSIYNSKVDNNFNYTYIEFKRELDTLYKTYEFLEPDAFDNYQIIVHEVYNDLGTAVIKRIAWRVYYDSRGYMISKKILYDGYDPEVGLVEDKEKEVGD